MKYLCLAYGREEDWEELSTARQQGLLQQDASLRDRGALMGAVQQDVITVRAWEGLATTSAESFANGNAPLVGFSIIEAADLDEAVHLVAGTPCAVARGAIEIRPILFMNEPSASSG